MKQFYSTWPRALVSSLLVLSILMLAGCGGTKVYNVSKTVVYKDQMYNVSNVQRFSSRMDATLPGGEVRGVRGMDRKSFEAMLDEHGEMAVKSFIEMDQQELLYEARMINRWSDFNKMSKNLASATDDIRKFMAHKKKTQLKL